MDGRIKQILVLLDTIRELKLQLESQPMEDEEAPDNSQFIRLELIRLCMQFIELYNTLDKQSRDKFFLTELDDVVFPLLRVFHYEPFIDGDGVAYAVRPVTSSAKTVQKVQGGIVKKTVTSSKPRVQGAKLRVVALAQAAQEAEQEGTDDDDVQWENDYQPGVFGENYGLVSDANGLSPVQSWNPYPRDLDNPENYSMLVPVTAVPVTAAYGKCQHGRQKSRCKDCGGIGICEHGRRKNTCKECGGSSICEHGRRKNICKECGGGSICEHGRQRSQCKDCGGGSVCEHGRIMRQCKECGGGSSYFCEHGRIRRQCKECGGGSSYFCEHGRQRSTCKQCRSNSQGHGGSKTRKSKKSYRNVKKSFRKNKKVVAHKKTKRLLKSSSKASSRKSHI